MLDTSKSVESSNTEPDKIRTGIPERSSSSDQGLACHDTGL